MTRPRLRDLGITIGTLPTGRYNAITDVPGVKVGHTTLIYDEPRIARTGVTVIIPREEPAWKNGLFAGWHNFNGNGEMTGVAWIEEAGTLTSNIAITNTHQVGVVRDALVDDAIRKGNTWGWMLPVVAETYDGLLNDIGAFHVTDGHVHQAIANASSGAVAEGCVGGGTGMICHQFKGGIGTSSRVVDTRGGQFTVGVLVQANYGLRRDLRVDGVPVGRHITGEHTPLPGVPNQAPFDFGESGSIIIIVATDAPVLPIQCQRLAQRATVGLARVGGMGYNSSGDIFLAFSTGNPVPSDAKGLMQVNMLPHEHINPLFNGVIESTEEAILNALCAAETTVGAGGRVAHALPLDELQRVMAMYRPG